MDITPQKNTFTGYNLGSIVRPGNDLVNSPYSELVLQIEAEYQSSYKTLNAKIAMWQKRLKLYNNQRRDEDTVGDPLLFTVMQTVIASLYDDQLLVDFNGRVEGDQDQAANLTQLARYDYDEMGKDELDYNWMWDTCFFGRSVVYMTNFDKKKNNTPMPDLQNPMLFYRDTKAVSINGDRNGRNACRFFGRDIEMTKPMMRENPEFFDMDMLTPNNGMNDQISQARQAYQDAQGLNTQSNFKESDYGDNAMFNLLEWCTYYKGKRVLVTLGNTRSKVVRYHEFKDENNQPMREWPVIDRPMYPTSHDWDGTSIPDIVEDKQRMRAIMQNLALKHMQADLYPMYVFNRKRIKNRNDLNFDFNKFVPIEGEGALQDAVAPLMKSPMNAGVHQYIMDTMANSVEKATSSPQMQQGSIENSKRTATEIGMVDRNVGTRYSLTAKVFGWSERRFWQQWYRLYKQYFSASIDKKIIRIEGAFGAKFQPLQREDIVLEIDPHIKIVSANVSRAEKAQVKQDYAQYLSLAAQVPGSDIRYGVKKLGRMITLEKDEIDRLFPETVDEMIAEDENIYLSKNKPIKVQANDDHQAHLQIHAKATDTPASFAHVAAHKKAMEIQKTNPQLFQQQQQQAQQAAGGGQPQQPGQPQAPGQQQSDQGQNPYDTAGTPGNLPKTADFAQQMANTKNMVSQLRSMQKLQ